MTSTDLALRQENGHVPRGWIALLEPAAALANQVAATGFVPSAMRGNPAAVVAAILYGDELGLGPMQSLAKINVIEGKPSLSAEAQRALILAAGHELWIEDGATATKVTVSGRRAGSERTSSVTWTLDDAKRANLAGKSNWRMYPRQMLTARATADLARAIFADVIGGLAATEELEDVDPLALPLEVEDKSATRAPTKRRRRKVALPAGVDPEDVTDSGPEPASPDLPPLPDEPAEPLVEPAPDVSLPAGDEPETVDGGSPASDELDFGESTEAPASVDDAGEVVPDDETTAENELPEDSSGASPADMPSATVSQRKALDSLVGRLRTTEVELEDGSKSVVLSTEQLWAATATRRNVEADLMIELLEGRDEAGVLHWSSLRDSLTKSEASDLIAKLEDRARKWGVE